MNKPYFIAHGFKVHGLKVHGLKVPGFKIHGLKTRTTLRAQSGLTMVEVLVAIAVFAMISVTAMQSFDAAHRGGEVSREKLKEIERFDRTWVTLERDLRHVLYGTWRVPYGTPVPAFRVDYGEDYPLLLFRGGMSNPLDFPRMEVARVAYRVEDDILWRHTWWNPGNMDEEKARKQKLLDEVEEITVKALPKSKRLQESDWLEKWPNPRFKTTLPIAVEVTIKHRQRGELTRWFPLATGT